MNFLPSSVDKILKTEKEFLSFLDGARSIRAIVAYWTLNSQSYLSERLIHLSIHENVQIELYIDISKPTDLDALEELSKGGIKIYLFLGRKIKGEKKLLHSKFWLVDTSISSRVLIGSHNITKASIEGQNIETSLIADASAGMIDYFNELILKISTGCDLFELSKKKFYSALQHDLSLLVTENIVPVLTEEASKVDNGYVLYLFSDEVEIDINSFDYVLVIGQKDRVSKIFKLRRFNSGNVYPSTEESYEIEFGDNRNFIWLHKNLKAFILNSGTNNLGRDQLLKCNSYAAIELFEEVDSNKFTIPSFPSQIWNSENRLHSDMDFSFDRELPDFETGDFSVYLSWKDFLESYLFGIDEDSNSLTHNIARWNSDLFYGDFYGEETYKKLLNIYRSFYESNIENPKSKISDLEFEKEYNYLVESIISGDFQRLRKYKAVFKIHRMKNRNELMMIYEKYFKE